MNRTTWLLSVLTRSNYNIQVERHRYTASNVCHSRYLHFDRIQITQINVLLRCHLGFNRESDYRYIFSPSVPSPFSPSYHLPSLPSPRPSLPFCIGSPLLPSSHPTAINPAREPGKRRKLPAIPGGTPPKKSISG